MAGFLDKTTCTFPVTFADRNLDVGNPHYRPLNATDEAIWRQCKRATIPPPF